MSNQQPTSLASVVAQLQQFYQEKLSGNMTILTQNRQMARIGIMNGSIVALSCANKRGVEALSLLQHFDPNWFQFIKGTSAITDPDLPPTPDILAILSGVSPASASPDSASNTTIDLLSQQVLTVLKATLAEFMGPVAPMICNEALRQSSDLRAVIDLLANQIPNRQQAVEFRSRVMQKLF